MAAVFTRRIISPRFPQKLRVFLTGKEISCCPPLYFYCPGYSNFVDNNRTNYVLKDVTLERRYVLRYFSDDAKKKTEAATEEEEKKETKKLTLLQRFKEMYKKYWYVLVPVHLVTSAFWFGGFYYLAKRYVQYCAMENSFRFYLWQTVIRCKYKQIIMFLQWSGCGQHHAKLQL